MTTETPKQPLDWSSVQPRYAAYGRARGAKTPDDLRAMDEAEHGHRNIGYLCWMDCQWREWCRLNGVHRDAPKSEAEHRAFDAWLEAAA